MRKRKRAAALIVVATLLGAGLRWTMHSDAATIRIPGPSETTTSVTLPTGDRITIAGAGRVSVERAPGREHATFLTRWDHGSLRVVPTDAAALVAAGRLDPRLFDVTRMLRAADDPPLLVGGKAQRVRPEARAALWHDLVGGRVPSVRLDERAGTAPAVSGGTVSGGTVSGGTVSGGTVSGGTVSEGIVDLRLRLIGRDGRPATANVGFLVGLDVVAGETVFDAAGEATVALPRGTYQLGVFIPTSAAERSVGTMLVQPRLSLTGPLTVVLDARLGRPVSIGVPQPGAVPVQAGIGYSDTAADGYAAGGELIADGTDGQYTAQIGGGATSAGFTSAISAAFRATADGDSPYAYHLAYYRRGSMWSGLDRHPARGDLAAVRTRVAQTAAGSTGRGFVYHELDGVSWGITWPQEGTSGPLPRTATEYFNADAGVRWQVNANELIGDPADPTGGQSYSAAATTYLPGRVYRQDWNRAAIGPGLPPRPVPELWLSRTGDRILVAPSWYNDAAGHDGRGDVRSTKFRIALGSQSIDRDFGNFTVPAGKDRYRLEVSADRGAPNELSTHVGTVWTFISAHVDGDTPQPLPLNAVRFAPALDDRNAAVAGRDLAVPVLVAPQPGSATAPVTALAVQVSFNDGATWTGVPVRRTATGGTALLHQPAAPGFVSLRATATDGSGNSVTQTVVRAYRLVAG